jgi:hypothetical protein
MSQRKIHAIWSSVEPAVYDAMMSYIEDNNTNISEFLRQCVAQKLLDVGYLSQDQLELILGYA